MDFLKSQQGKSAKKRQIAEKGLEKEIKVVRTGCFGMCEAGPVVIIYPEGAFYARMTVENVTRIVDEHLVKGRVVKELLYKEAEDRGMTRDEFDSALADSGLTVESQVDSVLALFDVSTLLSDVESELDSGKYGTILRAKGILPAVDGTWIHFDYVPEECNVRTGSADITGKLCVIGSKLDEKGIAALFGC